MSFLRTLLLAAAGVAAAVVVGGAVRAESLVLIGGGPPPDEAVQRFVEWAGGEHARILIITWGNGDPKAVANLVKKMSGLHPAEVAQSSVPPAPGAETEKFLEAVSRSTGVFFSGGRQNLIMSGLAGGNLSGALQKRYRAGAAFGGTSAGTAIMSKVMLTGEGDFNPIDGSKVGTSVGLGLLPADVIIDQHFVRRMRTHRLAGLVLQDPEKMGVGIDDGTALLIKDNRAVEVVGAGQVVVFDGRGPSADAAPADHDPDAGTLVMHVLKAGRKFDLFTRKPPAPDVASLQKRKPPAPMTPAARK